MTTITLSVPPDAKKYIKAKAAIEGVTMRDFVLRSVGWQKEEYTSDDFNEETRAAMNEDLADSKRYAAKELIAEMKTW